MARLNVLDEHLEDLDLEGLLNALIDSIYNDNTEADNEAEFTHNGDDDEIEYDCDGNCDECEFEEFLEPIVGAKYGFEDVLFFVKKDKYRAFTCHSFKNGEYIYLDDTTYDTPTLVKVSEHDMHSVYVPTAQDMFDYVWELVVED